MATQPGTPAANPNGAYPDQVPSGNLNTMNGNSGSPNEGYTGTGAPEASEADRMPAGDPEIAHGGSVTSGGRGGEVGRAESHHRSAGH